MLGQKTIVISMHWLPHFQHDKIGDINHIADGTHTRRLQAMLQPER